MAYTDTFPKTILSSGPTSYITLVEAAVAGDLITASGYLADAANYRWAIYVALGPGAVGATIPCSRYADVEGMSGGAGADTDLYLSCTVGKTVESAPVGGWLVQRIGKELSATRAILEPEFEAPDEPG